jgi:sirohydrochlorin ferrochelatase
LLLFRTLESGYETASADVSAQLESCRSQQQQYQQLQQQIRTEAAWLDSVAPALEPAAPLGTEDEVAALSTALIEHSAAIERLQHQGALLASGTMSSPAAESEREELERGAGELAARAARLRDAAAQRGTRLARAVTQRAALEAQVQHVTAWLEAKEAEAPPTLALTPATVARQLEALKVNKQILPLLLSQMCIIS